LRARPGEWASSRRRGFEVGCDRAHGRNRWNLLGGCPAYPDYCHGFTTCNVQDKYYRIILGVYTERYSLPATLLQAEEKAPGMEIQFGPEPWLDTEEEGEGEGEDKDDSNPFCAICGGSVSLKRLWWIKVKPDGEAVPVSEFREDGIHWRVVCPKCARKLQCKFRTETPEFRTYRKIYFSRRRKSQ